MTEFLYDLFRIMTSTPPTSIINACLSTSLSLPNMECASILDATSFPAVTSETTIVETEYNNFIDLTTQTTCENTDSIFDHALRVATTSEADIRERSPMPAVSSSNTNQGALSPIYNPYVTYSNVRVLTFFKKESAYIAPLIVQRFQPSAAMILDERHSTCEPDMVLSNLLEFLPFHPKPVTFYVTTTHDAHFCYFNCTILYEGSSEPLSMHFKVRGPTASYVALEFHRKSRWRDICYLYVYKNLPLPSYIDSSIPMTPISP